MLLRRWGRIDAVPCEARSRDEASAIRLLSRVLQMRRATSDLVANLLDESIAYQLVWPN
ncbi:MAG TPA: hypothetical protein VGE01_04690 [Fimbriimonas sp.]